MTKLIYNSGLGAFALLFLSALPGGASTITFTVGTISGATITTASNCDNCTTAVSVLSVPFTSLTVSTPLAIDPLTATLAYNSVADTLTLTSTGTQTGVFSNISAATVIETIYLPSALIATISPAGAFSLNSQAITYVTMNSTFASDLGGVYAANPPNVITNIGVTGTQIGGGTSYTDNSNTMTQTTPEPASCILLGSALLATGILGRRKLFKSK
jgi:hypothetical protein